MHFPTQFDRLTVAREKRPHFFTAAGSGIVYTYKAHLEDDGNITLELDKEHNLYEEIQSHRASVDMAVIVNRYMNGDPSVLSHIQGFYADITDAPQSMHEAISLMRKAENDFKLLPVEIQAEFDNDYNKFIMSLGTEEWLQKMQIPQAAEEAAASSGESLGGDSNG
jgi:hypothetical protein